MNLTNYYYYWSNVIPHRICDMIIPQPLGGAHRNWDEIFDTVKAEVLDVLKELHSNNTDESYLKQPIKKYNSLISME